MTPVTPVTDRSIQAAAEAWATGQLVAFPTETVYGLGADALNPQAVAKIFAAKGRPADHPLIVHVADQASAQSLTSAWPSSADRLARAFWPGPLTLILKKSDRVPLAVTGGQDTVGLRVPSHATALALLKAFSEVGSGAVAAPSANRFGGVSPTRARDVSESLAGRLSPADLILDAGDCGVGLESSIVDCTVQPPRLLRPGGLSRAEIEAVVPLAAEAPEVRSPRVSGSLAAHYAPRTPLYLLPVEQLWPRLADQLQQQPRSKLHCWVFRLMPEHGSLLSQAKAPADPQDYGRQLYARLHDWDGLGFDALYFEAPPQTPAWEAVWDRLRRAAYGSQLGAGPRGELETE